MEKYEEVERSLITSYRKRIWNQFIRSIREFEMVEDGDKIAVCISGGKDSMLLAKLFQELKKHGKQNFEVVYLSMNPGYNELNKQKIISNAKLLNIPITFFETNIFNVVDKIDDHPCYVCARMRRGFLYKKAKELGCNKIALGHHFDDVIETILIGMFYGSQMQTMMPKVLSTSHPGMELIRPMYYIKEADILAWKKRHDLDFIQCACRFTENIAIRDNGSSKRAEIKKLIAELRQTYNKVDINIFRSAQNVNLDTLLSYHKKGEPDHSFLEDYRKKKMDILKNGVKTYEMILNVDGMNSNDCENRIQNVISIIDGVEEVVANYKDGTVKIISIKEMKKDFIKKKLNEINYIVK